MSDKKMDFAVIEFNKNQYKVEEGKNLSLPYFPVNEKKKSIDFDKVILASIGGKTEVGTSYLENISVSGEVIGEERSDKIRVFKFKPKKRYKRTYGQRSKFIVVKITSIKMAKKAK
jgi:large subunit ribosomal protein L21